MAYSLWSRVVSSFRGHETVWVILTSLCSNYNIWSIKYSGEVGGGGGGGGGEESKFSLSVDINQIGGNKTHLSTGFLILIDRNTILLTITNITIILLLRHVSGIQTVFLHQFALFLFLASS